MMKLALSIVVWIFFWIPATAQLQVNWKAQEIIKDGRIDAIADLGDGVIIAGSRWPNSGMIFRSTDYGITWKKVKDLTGPKGTYLNNEILGLMGGPGNYAYLITSNAHFWRSKDKGLTWEKTAELDAQMGKMAWSYSICVTRNNTVLVTRGFYVYRSTDNGLHFEKTGPVSDNFLYRLQEVGNSIFVNGWAGRLYKSEDDGKTWDTFSQLGPATFPLRIIKPYNPLLLQPHLTAIEYLGGDVFMQGTTQGENYRIHQNKPDQIEASSKFSGGLDDYAYLGYGTVIASNYLDSLLTYRGERNNYISYNSGETWQNLGVIPTGVSGDWLDHVIKVDKRDSVIAIGGTSKGFIVRAAFLRDDLKRLAHEAE